MNLLISTPQNDFFTVAIGDKTIVDFKIVKTEYSQSEMLLKTIEELVKRDRPARRARQVNYEIKKIFVVEGPGAFSALRVGIATANALAYALNVPVAGIRIEIEWTDLTPEEQLEKIWEKIKQQKIKKSKQPVNQKTSKPENRFVRPFYGMEPHITRKNEKTEKPKNEKTEERMN